MDHICNIKVVYAGNLKHTACDSLIIALGCKLGDIVIVVLTYKLESQGS